MFYLALSLRRIRLVAIAVLVCSVYAAANEPIGSRKLDLVPTTRKGSCCGTAAGSLSASDVDYETYKLTATYHANDACNE